MPRKPVFAASAALRIPQLRRHRPSGRAVVTLNGRDLYVGAWGTVAAKAEYDRLIGEWLANGRRLDANDLRIADLVERYLEFAREYYRTERSTGVDDPLYRALDDLLDLYASERVVDFGPLKLKALRQKWIDVGKVRDQINKSVHRVRQLFRCVAKRLAMTSTNSFETSPGIRPSLS